MKVLQAVTIAVAVATLCLLQTLQTEARDIVRADTKCSCDPQGPAYQLLRGDNQVHDCEVGFYCDCAKGKRLQCFAPPFIKWKYDEDNQWCALNFDCAAFFKRATTTTEPPTTTTEPTTTTTEPTTTEPPTTEPPTTEPTTTEPTTTEPTTTEPPTTEPTTPEPTTTEATTTEPPTTEPTTPEPTTTEPTTTTPEPTTEASTTTVEPTTDLTTALPTPTPSAGCTCNPNGPDYQLIRGEDELEKCDDGYYCKCSNGEVDRCLDVAGYGWRFNEKDQSCEFEFDCQSYLRPSTTAEPSTTTTEATTPEPSTTEPPTTEPSTTEPSTTEPSTTTTEASTTTEPSTTVPSTTEPSTTTTTEASTTTEPSTTEPSTTTTEPSTTAEPSTTEPSTTETSTPEPSTPEPSTTEAASTPAPGPLAECTCDPWWGHLYELVRGEDQASSCTHGYYCDCSQGKRLRCVNVLTLGWRFDEDAQKCRLFHGCAAVSN